MTDLDRYLTEIVDPCIAEFSKCQWSRRRAFIACVCLFHTVDYFPGPLSPKARRQTFVVASTDFAAVDRVAHAFKHEHTGDEKNPRIKPLRNAHVRSRPPAILGRMILNLSRLGDAVGGVMIGGDDLFPIVTRARAFIAEQQRVEAATDHLKPNGPATDAGERMEAEIAADRRKRESR